MRNSLSKHYLDTSKIPNLVLVGLKDWIDFSTKEKKGITAQLMFQENNESVIISVKLLDKSVSDYEKYLNKSIKLENLWVVPWVRNNSNWINYSYQSDNIKGVN